MAKHSRMIALTGSALTRTEMHAYYIAVLCMPTLVFRREELTKR